MTLREQLDNVQLRALIVRSWNMGVVAMASACLIALIVCWAISIGHEAGEVKARHSCSIIAFIFTVITIICDVISLYAEPGQVLLTAVQALSVLSMMLTAIAAGMAGIVVDLCTQGQQSPTVHCGAHYAEYAVSLLVCLCMGSVFVTNQQKLVLLVDRGVLTGIGSRMARIDGP
jgi:hypothetical protein